MSQAATPPTRPESSPEMAAVGYFIAAGVFILLLPIAPVIAALWVLYRVFGGNRE